MTTPTYERIGWSDRDRIFDQHYDKLREKRLQAARQLVANAGVMALWDPEIAPTPEQLTALENLQDALTRLENLVRDREEIVDKEIAAENWSASCRGTPAALPTPRGVLLDP